MKRIILSIIELAVAYVLIFFAVSGQVVRGGDEVARSIPAPSDPTGFTNALNGMRIQAGLPAVQYDPGIVGIAERNNAFQHVHGLGHWFLGGLAQCAGVGQPDFRSVLNAWAMSPGHAAILFSPSLTAVGYHQSGSCHTVACLMGGSAPMTVGPMPTMPMVYSMQARVYRPRFRLFRRQCR